MKKIILTSLILIFGGLCYGTPVPQQEHTGADSSYHMDSQNILRGKNDGPDKNLMTETSTENSGEFFENNNATEETNNPINYDASRENIQDKNFQPTQKIEEPEPKKVDTSSEQQAETKKDKKKKNKKNTENTEHETSEATNSDETEVKADEITTPKTYSQDDYEQMYREMPVPTFTFVHGVDPEQYYDMKDSTWSPYPLFRLNAPLYFKTITIQPGYYLLTPRKYKGDWYLLFKEAGVVKYTIPVFAKDYTPEFYYRDNLPELEMDKTQRWQIKFLNAWGKYIRKSKRKPAIKTNVELTDLDNNFLLIEIYYGAHKYSTIFRTERF